MTQEEINILNVDLCTRLPYGVKIKYLPDDRLNGIVLPYLHNGLTVLQKGVISYRAHIKSIRPYLRPMSSMTEDENKIFERLKNEVKNSDGTLFIANCNLLQRFFHSRHLDNNHLIESGLAIEAPEEMYKTK